MERSGPALTHATSTLATRTHILPLHLTVAATLGATKVRCAFFDRILHSRCVTNGIPLGCGVHFLTGSHCKLRPNIEGKCSSFRFNKNIVFQPGNYTGAMVVGSGSTFAHALDNFTFDDNVYYKETDPTGKTVAFNYTDTFKAWQTNGKDAHSLIANPKFANISDFTLDPSSPAIPLGFKPIDISTVGPVGPVGPTNADGKRAAAKTANVAAALGTPELVRAGFIVPSQAKNGPELDAPFSKSPHH
jgi:hypothetical protein